LAIVPETETKTVDAHRLEMIRLAEDIDARSGIAGNPMMTIEELHESQRASGIRSEDNTGSRELMRMRHGDEWDKE
jgi:hypothetical protein